MTAAERIRIHVQIERENKRKLEEWKGWLKGMDARYYLIITTTIGRLNLGDMGLYYNTQDEAEEIAEKAKRVPGTLKVWICRTK